MPELPVLNILCQECQNIFEGHWVCRDDVETKSPNDKNITEDEAGEISSLRRGSENSSDSDSNFYEKPDWVKSMSADRAFELSWQTVNFGSPLHHSIKDLEISAQNGCHLCTLFWDQLSTKLKEVTEADEARLQQAKGIIVVRPRPSSLEDDADKQALQPLMLEVSYFVDGNCESESSYISNFNIDFDIHKTESTSRRLASSTLFLANLYRYQGLHLGSDFANARQYTSRHTYLG